MNNQQFFIYLILLSGSTYLIRTLPFVLAKNKIENQLIKSFLYYIPYAVLTAMTLPAILYATSSLLSASVGLLVAVLLAVRNKSLLTVATFACLAVFLVELFL